MATLSYAIRTVMRTFLNIKLFCKLGATVKRLVYFIKNRIREESDADVNFVILHVGTNKLCRSVWEWTGTQYIDLYHMVWEIFPSSFILFSAIVEMYLHMISIQNKLPSKLYTVYCVRPI